MKRSARALGALRALKPHRALLLLLFFGLFVPLRLFWEVAEGVYEQGGFAADQVILRALHAHDTPFWDGVMLTLSRIGGPTLMPLIGLLIAALLWWRRYRVDALFFALALVGATLINVLVKAIVGRQRPDLWPALAPESGFSFPSGHAMASAALAASLIAMTWHTRFRWPVALFAALFAFGVGVSRMYIGVHYPSDVLAGWIASVAWVTGLHLIFSRRGSELRALYRAAVSRWRRRSGPGGS